MQRRTSTVPAVKQGLMDVLRARPGVHDVAVVYGPPLNVGDNDFIWLGTVEGVQSWAALNAVTRPKDENYTVEVIINIKRSGDATQLATERCFELLAELEDELRVDPSINGTLGAPGRAAVEEFRLVENLADDGSGRVSQLSVSVSVLARI